MSSFNGTVCYHLLLNTLSGSLIPILGRDTCEALQLYINLVNKASQYKLVATEG